MSATLQSTSALAPLNQLQHWWGDNAITMPWQRLMEASLASQRICTEAASEEMRFLFAAQERLRRCCERVSGSRKPQEFLDAQAELMAAMFDTASQQAKAMNDTAEHLRSCYAGVANGAPKAAEPA